MRTDRGIFQTQLPQPHYAAVMHVVHACTSRMHGHQSLEIADARPHAYNAAACTSACPTLPLRAQQMRALSCSAAIVAQPLYAHTAFQCGLCCTSPTRAPVHVRLRCKHPQYHVLAPLLHARAACTGS
eukprot:232656-Chlamydomonas_euryale.AAC.2